MPHVLHRRLAIIRKSAPSALIATITLLQQSVITAADQFPDRIDVGLIHVGGTAEASVRVFWDASARADADAAIVSPTFIAIKESTTGLHNSGINVLPYTDVVVTFDTSATGVFEGEIEVTYRTQQATIPVVAEVVAGGAKHVRVLIAQTPFHRQATETDSDFDEWRKLIRVNKIDVSYLEVKRGSDVLRDIDLSGFQVILLGTEGVSELTDVDLDRLHEFVGNGGRLVVTASASHTGSVDHLNRVAKRYGLIMFDTDIPAPPSVGLKVPWIESATIQASPLTQNVAKVTLLRPAPVAAIDRVSATILVADGSGNGLIGHARRGRGDIVVIATSLWALWLNDVESDNARLMRNILFEGSPN
jgi:hypothetical protein